MGWRIVYIEDAVNVRLYLDNVKVEKETNSVTIPLADIHTLIIDNYKINLSVQLITKCSEYNINLILCSINHMPQTISQPFTGNFQTPLMLKKQLEWSESYKLLIHKLIIKNKIFNQKELLIKLNKSLEVITKLNEFMNEVDEGDTKNREGLSAKMYFRELFGSKFKRFDEDVINYGLNYGYSILRSQISKTIIAKGLNPCIGIIHKGYNNPFNLSDDIIEVFRPIIDFYVFNNMLESIVFKKDDRLGLIKSTTQDVKIDGVRQSLFNAIGIFIDGIITMFDCGDISKFKKIELLYEL